MVPWFSRISRSQFWPSHWRIQKAFSGWAIHDFLDVPTTGGCLESLQCVGHPWFPAYFLDGRHSRFHWRTYLGPEPGKLVQTFTIVWRLYSGWAIHLRHLVEKNASANKENSQAFCQIHAQRCPRRTPKSFVCRFIMNPASVCGIAPIYAKYVEIVAR